MKEDKELHDKISEATKEVIENRHSNESISDEELKRLLEEFARDLASKQENLSPEFQKIINDNFWELLMKDN